LCQKEGHTVVKCSKRFDTSFTGAPQKSASSATTASYGVDTNWYLDTGATDHITSDLKRLTVRDKYNGGDQVHAANGSGMEIVHVGDSILHSPSIDIHLKHVLHVPKAHKNLASVHRLTRDNCVFLEFHPDYFDIKEEETKRVILRGRCKGGLYPLRSSFSNKSFPDKQALGAIRPTASLWHYRLGHATTLVVRQVLSRHKLPFVKESNNNHVCNACQQGKAHQLPFPRSSSMSARPLDLIFSDVWGPAPTSVGRHNFYVSFIDDHSKFVWIICCVTSLKFSSVFIIFNLLWRDNLIEKFSLFKLIGVENINLSTPSSSELVLNIACHVLILISKMVQPKGNIDI
jgi:hypothetical protein